MYWIDYEMDRFTEVISWSGGEEQIKYLERFNKIKPKIERMKFVLDNAYKRLLNTLERNADIDMKAMEYSTDIETFTNNDMLEELYYKEIGDIYNFAIMDTLQLINKNYSNVIRWYNILTKNHTIQEPRDLNIINFFIINHKRFTCKIYEERIKINDYNNYINDLIKSKQKWLKDIKTEIKRHKIFIDLEDNIDHNII